MAIRAACRCGKEFLAKDELAGRQVKCPVCGQAMLVPGGSTAGGSTGAVPAARQQPPPQRPVAQQRASQQPTPHRNDPLGPQGFDDPLGPLGEMGSFDSLDPLGSGLPVGDPLDTPLASPGLKSLVTRPAKPDPTAAPKAKKTSGKPNKTLFYAAIGAGGTLVVAALVGIIALVVVWAGAQQSIKLTGHSDGVIAADFSADGQLLASASRDGSVKLWEVSSGAVQRSWPAKAQKVVFSPDGRLVAAACEKQILLWNAQTGESAGNLEIAFESNQAPWQAECIAISRDGRLLAVGGNNWIDAFGKGNGVAVWDLMAEDRAEPLYRLEARAACLAFSSDGRYLAVGGGSMNSREGGSSGSVSLFDVTTGQGVDTWHVPTGGEVYDGVAHPFGRTTCLAFSPDGTILASADADTEALVEGQAGLNKSRSTLKLWQIPTGKEVLSIEPEIKQCTGIFFAADGKSIIVGGGNPFPTMKTGAVKEFDVATGKLLKTRIQAPYIVECLAATSDRTRFAWAASDDLDRGPSAGALVRRMKEREQGLPASSSGAPQQHDSKMTFQIWPL